MQHNPLNENRPPFWEMKSLEEMTEDEWESLCDGCAVCCLEKLEDKGTGTIEFTPLSCEFLDTATCRCRIYEYRLVINPDCIELTPEMVKQMSWLPDTCAYRRLHEGGVLETWHPLVSGNTNTVHKAGISIRYKAVSIKDIHPGDIVDFLS